MQMINSKRLITDDIESKEEYYNVLTEYLLLTKEGQVYIKDISFDKLPVGEYNITVLINVRQSIVMYILKKITYFIFLFC